MGKNNVKTKAVIVGIIFVVILIVIILVCSKIGGNVMGNSAGNISNFGYSVQKGKNIYYVALDEKMERTNIYRTHIDKYETELIFQGDYDMRSLNVVGDELYFVNVKVNEDSAEAEASYTKNEICKINLEGSEFSVINDQVSNEDFNMQIINDEIFYVGTDFNVYKMDLAGENHEIVAETGTGFLTINDKYIIYNKENPETGGYISHINELEKSSEKAINGEEIYFPSICGEEIYYINTAQQMVKISLNNGQEDVVDDDFVYAINFDGKNIYYLKQKKEDDQIGIYKRNLANGEAILMKELAYYTSFINVINGYIYYIDIDDYSSYIKLLDIDSFEEVKLKEWKYKE